MLNKVHQWDVTAFLAIDAWRRYRPMHLGFRILSRSGDGLLYLVAVILVVWLDPDQFAQFTRTIATALGIGLPAHVAIKRLVRRARPCDTKIRFAFTASAMEKFSFPSGHTTHAFLLALVVTDFYPALAIALYFWAAGVGLSRIYLGVHYPSDVVAGIALGTSSAASVLWVF